MQSDSSTLLFHGLLRNDDVSSRLDSAPPLCLFLDTFYERFLETLYQRQPELKNASFAEQLNHLISINNGDSDFYSSGLRACSWRAEQLVINSPWMQAAWAKEHGVTLQGDDLIVEQVARLKPEVVYCQDMHQMSEALLQRIKPHCKLLVGQIATSILHTPIHRYDVIVSSIHPIVEYIRTQGITSFYVPLAFSPRVAEGLQLPEEYVARPIPCSFVGSIASHMHLKRAQFLTTIAEQTPLKIWGVGAELLPPDSQLRACYQGQAWGPDLFWVLGSSKITLNCHGEVLYNKEHPKNSTEEFANNMRLYEATGMGALLITEYRQNLADLFDIGKEIVVYRDTDECAALIKYYLERPEKAQEIALAGKERTFAQHSYALRMQRLSQYLKRLLLLKSEAQQEIDYSKISYDFRPLGAESVSTTLTNAWKDAEIPPKQRALVRNELTKMYKGSLVPPFKSIKEILGRVLRSGDNVLEIGCSSGYYLEVISYLLPKEFRYTGVDYSAPMVQMARDYYPDAEFTEASGDDLPWVEETFDLTISGCILLHCPNYDDHLRETARVTKRSIVLARTPVCKNHPTRYFSKKAYGVETVELVFNETELLNRIHSLGFRLTHYLLLDQDRNSDLYTVTYAFIRAST